MFSLGLYSRSGRDWDFFEVVFRFWFFGVLLGLGGVVRFLVGRCFFCVYVSFWEKRDMFLGK